MNPSITYRSDYREPTHNIDSVNLVFDLDPQTSTVYNTMSVSPRTGGDLVLNASGLELVSIHEHGVLLPASRYTLTPDALVIRESRSRPLSQSPIAFTRPTTRCSPAFTCHMAIS